ncbi:MAG: DHHA1 domain-containing protein [Candidatus Aenigmatarchaeota archaeon]
MKIVEEIKKAKKVQIICDEDLDGLTAAFLMSRILKFLRKNFKITVRQNSKKLKELADKNFDTYILLDLPFEDKELIEFAEKNSKKKIIYIDHHKREIPENIPKNLIYHDIRALKVKPLTSVSGYVYKIGKNIFGKKFLKYSIFGFIGSYADYFFDKEILKDLKNQYKKLLLKEIPNIAFFIVVSLLYFSEPRDCLKYLELIEKDFYSFLKKIKPKRLRKLLNYWKNSRKIFENNKLIVIESKKAREIATILASFINKTVLVISKKRKTAKVSLRSDEIDCGKFLAEFTKKYGIVGGGHPQAAGATIKKKDIKKLIKELKNKL